jgi:hypothetical protein
MLYWNTENIFDLTFSWAKDINFAMLGSGTVVL